MSSGNLNTFFKWRKSTFCCSICPLTQNSPRKHTKMAYNFMHLSIIKRGQDQESTPSLSFPRSRSLALNPAFSSPRSPPLALFHLLSFPRLVPSLSIQRFLPLALFPLLSSAPFVALVLPYPCSHPLTPATLSSPLSDSLSTSPPLLFVFF